MAATIPICSIKRKSGDGRRKSEAEKGCKAEAVKVERKQDE
jgi:hypothetical protein